MPAQSSIVVCKPQVAFSERKTDPSFQRLTVTQLRKQARLRKLDVSRLIQKWEFIHVLVQNDLYGGPVAHVKNVTDAKRRTIFDLPGEIRNTIYGYVLAIDDPVVARYDPPRNRHLAPDTWLFTSLGRGPEVPGQPDTILQLRNMSWANRELRKEVRSFFFARKRFKVVGHTGSSHVDFLNDIGSVARTNITMLNLSGKHFNRHKHRFVNMLHECTSLRSLTMHIHVGHLFSKDTYAALDNYVFAQMPDWEKNNRELEVKMQLGVFTSLHSLENLHIVVAFHTWLYQLGGAYSLAGARCVEVMAAVQEAVFQELKKCLKEKGVKVTVTTGLGTP